MRRRNWKRVRMNAEAVSVSRCCGHVLTSRPSTCPRLQTLHHSVTCLFSGSSEGKRLWDILQSRPTKELFTKIPLTFCHRDCILPCFCILLLMQISPYFYTLPAILLEIWGELGSVLTPTTKSRDFKHCLWKTEHSN